MYFNCRNLFQEPRVYRGSYPLPPSFPQQEPGDEGNSEGEIFPPKVTLLARSYFGDHLYSSGWEFAALLMPDSKTLIASFLSQSRHI